MSAKIATLICVTILISVASICEGKKGHKIIVSSTGGKRQGCSCHSRVHQVPIPIPVPVPVHMPHHHSHFGHMGAASGGNAGGGFGERMDMSQINQMNQMNQMSHMMGMNHLPQAFAERMAYGWRKKRSLSSLFKTLSKSEVRGETQPPVKEVTVPAEKA